MSRTIIQADVLGFCAGVKSAMEIALKARRDFPAAKIFTFDQLIHNMEAIRFLERKKIYALKKETALSPEHDFSDAIIIVCAHGIEVGAKELLEKKFFRVIDATCPHVLQSQKKAFTAASENFSVILVGEKNHQEILSLKSYVELADKKPCTVIANAAEAEAFSLREDILPVCLIAQTTLKQSEYEQIIRVFSQKISAFYSELHGTQLKVFKTICPATQKRQEALIKLAGACDVVVVVGGKNSTNTNRLFRTALQLNPHSFLVENADELPPELFSAQIIGITAGASTPDFVLDEITKKLQNP